MNLEKIRSSKFFVTELLLGVFVLFTLLLKIIDVKPIGQEDSKVGFATINEAFAKMLPYNAFWYKLAEVLGIVILLVVAAFGLIGLLQLVQGRSLRAVDDRILLLGAFYIIVFILYILFDKVALNYRPVIIDAAEGLEPSYPSSHTMLAACVVSTALMQIDVYLRNPQYNRIAKIGLLAVGVLTVLARFLSGAHWFTDIIGALLISACLVSLYVVFLRESEASSKGRGRHEVKTGKH